MPPTTSPAEPPGHRRQLRHGLAADRAFATVGAAVALADADKAADG